MAEVQQDYSAVCQWKKRFCNRCRYLASKNILTDVYNSGLYALIFWIRDQTNLCGLYFDLLRIRSWFSELTCSFNIQYLAETHNYVVVAHGHGYDILKKKSGKFLLVKSPSVPWDCQYFDKANQHYKRSSNCDRKVENYITRSKWESRSPAHVCWIYCAVDQGKHEGRKHLHFYCHREIVVKDYFINIRLTGPRHNTYLIRPQTTQELPS